MSTKLDEMMSFAENGCINDPVEAGKIITELAYCTVGELSSEAVSWCGRLLNFFFLPTENAPTLCYGELVNLLRLECCELKGDDYAASLGVTLFKLSENSMHVKLFKAVTLGAFTDFIDRKSKTLNGTSVYNRVADVARSVLDTDISRGMTFNRLYSKFGSLTAWRIGTSLQRFAERASAYCLITKLLLIDCFRFAFSDLFVLSDLKDKLVGYGDNWEKKADFYRNFEKADDGSLKADRTDSFGDEYDTEAYAYLKIGKPTPAGFTLSDSEKEEWQSVTDKLRRDGTRCRPLGRKTV